MVLLLPLGATPLRMRLASSGVKLTKFISPGTISDVDRLVRSDEELVFRRDDDDDDNDDNDDDDEDDDDDMDLGLLSAAAAAEMTEMVLMDGGRDGGVGGIEARRWWASYWDWLE